MTPSIGKDYCVSSHWLLAALYLLISPLAFAHYPESDKQHVKTVAPLSLSKAQSKLQVDDLLVTAERYSARENRINLAIIGDGYQVEELESLYQATVRDTLDYFFTHPKSAPYPRYQAFFNVFRIDIASNDSGVDDLEREIYRDTALGGENACTDYTIGICGADWSLVHEAFDLAEISAGFVADWRLVLLNDDSYNAAAHYAADGTLPIYSANYQGVWDMRDIALHESAHAWHYLADEYGGDPGIYPYAEPSEVNVTKDSSGAKWSEWLDYVMPDGMVVGAYEGGRYYDRGIFRPTISSKMNGGPADCHNIDNDCGHNAVSIQKIILDIYRLVRPLDGHTPAETVLTDPESLSVMVIDPEVVKVNWSIDGQRIVEAGPETLVLDEFLKVPGAYQVTAHAYDEVVVHAFSDNARPHSLDLVRRDFELLQQTVTWQVEIGDNDADGTGNNADTDDDNDGVLDTADAFPLISLGSLTDSDGDGRPNDCDSDCVTLGMTADSDDDNDGILDTADAFSLISLGSLTDTDGDGRPNDCDSDCQTLGMTADSDDDGDGVLDAADAFPLDAAESIDTDSDGTGNNVDTDDDGDGVLDTADAFPLDAAESIDTDSDGTGNNADTDDDGDGVLDTADAFPLDAAESIDTDSDGTGNNADTDDDGDGYSDAFESNSGTNALDALSYPSSGGYINARAWLVRGDQLSAKAKVRVQRLFSSKGAVSVNFRTLDGVNSKAGDAYVAATGTLNWLEGDEQEKVIEIDLISDDQYSSHNFYVELYDPSPEGALLGWKTMIYYDGFFLNKKLDDFAGFLSLGESESTFGEGTNNVIWLNRFQSSNGTAQIKYSITGCSGYLDEVGSDPREAVITWADGDAEPKPIQLNFLENELNLNRRLDCTFKVYLSEVEPMAAGFNSAHVLLNYGWEFLVYNNDFDRPVVHAAQAAMATSEGEKEVEIKIVRRGPPIRESVINIADTLDLTGYSRYWQFAKSGTHFDYPATAETLTWTEGDASTKSIFLSMKDDELLEREELVVLEPSGDDFDSFRYLYVYSLSDEPILLDGDIDQDGIPDREDADMDGDGLLDWWDLDRDGDGYSLESDSHWWDPNQSIDSDYDGVADNLDWAPEDPGEQFDTDSDGTGNNADTDDDNDEVSDADEAKNGTNPLLGDTDGDGVADNLDEITVALSFDDRTFKVEITTAELADNPITATDFRFGPKGSSCFVVLQSDKEAQSTSEKYVASRSWQVGSNFLSGQYGVIDDTPRIFFEDGSVKYDQQQYFLTVSNPDYVERK